MERALHRFGLLALQTLIWTLPLGMGLSLLFGWVRLSALNLSPFLSPFEQASVSQRYYFQIAVSITGLIYFAWCVLGGRLRVPRSIILGAALLFGTAAVLSGFNARSTVHTLREAAFLGCGILLLGMIVHLRPTAAESQRLLISLVLAAAVCAVVGILQYCGANLRVGNIGFAQNVNGGRFSVRSLLGHPNYLAVFVGSVFFLCPGLIAGSTSRGPRGVLTAAMTALGICIFVAGSRSIWLATVLVGGVLILVGVPFLRRVRLSRSALAGAVMLAIVFALFVVPNPLVPHRYSFTRRLLSARPVEGRLYIYLTAMRMIGRHPILGVGYNDYGLEFWDQVAAIQAKPGNEVFSFILEDIGGIRADQAHNEYLQIAAETGILGLGTFIFLIVVFFWRLAEHYRRSEMREERLLLAGMGGAVAVILIDSMFSFPLRLPWSTMVFWLMLGLGGGYVRTVAVAEPVPAESVATERKSVSTKRQSGRRRRKRSRSR